VRPFELIVQPEDGAAPIVNAIRRARQTLEITIFRLHHRGIAEALQAAVTRGVRIRALIAASSREGTRTLRRLEWHLLASGVIVARASDRFARYHAKMMIVDGRTLHVHGFNCTRRDLDSRSFGIVTTDTQLVQQAIRLFEGDLAHRPVYHESSGLVVSPENARERLESFVRGARHELLIYDSKIADPRIIRLLEERAKAQVDVRIIGHPLKHRAFQWTKLKGRRLHIRAIVRDGTTAFVGSQGLHSMELDARREVGVIVNDPVIVHEMRSTFVGDWPRDAERSEPNDRPEAQR
jgi:phosphatidylserine/phosphatidylglycerophosphate/cardiolipin synthase-like enzyme